MSRPSDEFRMLLGLETAEEALADAKLEMNIIALSRLAVDTKTSDVSYLKRQIEFLVSLVAQAEKIVENTSKIVDTTKQVVSLAMTLQRLGDQK